jgi:hydroxyacylglutathione hydrolase
MNLFEDLRVTLLLVGKWKTNCYLIEKSGKSIIIDPGDDFNVIVNTVKKLKTSLKAVLCTHGHFDHVGIVAYIKRFYQIPFYLHSEDTKLLHHANLYRRLAGGVGVYDTPKADHDLKEQNVIQFGNIMVNVLKTPGHTNGSVSFLIDDCIFSGETLFESVLVKNSLVQLGMKDSNPNLLGESMKRFNAIKGDVWLYPGHGSSCSLSEALIRNE